MGNVKYEYVMKFLYSFFETISVYVDISVAYIPLNVKNYTLEPSIY
jgi:hypothetical protein